MDRSTIRALPATVGNAEVCAAIVTGIVTPSMVAEMVAPVPMLLASANALVAIAGTAAGAAVPEVSVIVPARGSSVMCAAAGLAAAWP